MNQTPLAFSFMIGVLRSSGEGRCCVPLIQLEFLLSDHGGPRLLTASQMHWQAKALLQLELLICLLHFKTITATSFWKKLKVLGYLRPILT